jgi:hypothetical protein
MRRRKEEERVESTAYVVVFGILLCQVERLLTNSVAVSSWIWVELTFFTTRPPSECAMNTIGFCGKVNSACDER